MEEDRTSLSGTQSNDTIIELAGAAMDSAKLPSEKLPSDNECDEGTTDYAEDDRKATTNGPQVVSPGLLLLDLLKLKRRKIGHRRVTEGGEVTFKKIRTGHIVGSIQLGVGQAVGSLQHKHPERDLLMQDFALVETTAFPGEGSPSTPAHRFPDFKFRAYAPVAFRHFRDLFGIRPDDFLVSLCDRPMVELSNPGASGSIFYLTSDDDLIVKTVDHREADFLQKLLPGYYMNVCQNPRTLLPKFFGLYCYQCSNKNVRLVVMNNLLPSCIKMHERYDLKGSTYKRKASKAERKKRSPTYKDLDWGERHPDGILLDPETHSALMSTLRRDCRVLESFKIMDYSLLVGIHNLDEGETAATEKEKEDGGEKVSGGLTRSKSMNRQRLAAFSTALESINLDAKKEAEEKKEDETEEEEAPPGGIPARNSRGERLLLFLGIIDILQSFVLKKKLEHTFKSIVHDGDTVSVHRPGFYAQRFLKFMEECVFRCAAPPPLKHTPSRRKGGKGRRQDSGNWQQCAEAAAGREQENCHNDTVQDPCSTSSRPKNPLSLSMPKEEQRPRNIPLQNNPPEAAKITEDIPERSLRNKRDIYQKAGCSKDSQYEEEDIEMSQSSYQKSKEEYLRNIPSPKEEYMYQKAGCSRDSQFEYLEDELSRSYRKSEFVEAGRSVTFAETEVLELSQVVIETFEDGGKWDEVSTPTYTEGTPSFTESSPSSITPSRSLGKSVDSLPILEESNDASAT